MHALWLPRFDNAAVDGYAIRTADVVDAKVDAPTILKAREHS